LRLNIRKNAKLLFTPKRCDNTPVFFYMGVSPGYKSDMKSKKMNE